MTVRDSRLTPMWLIVARMSLAVVGLLVLATIGALVFMPLLILAVVLLFTVIPCSVWIAWSSRHQRGMRLLCYLEQATRLNLPLPDLIGAAARGERGILSIRLAHLQRALAKGAPISLAMMSAAPELPARTVRMVSFAEQIGRLPQTLRRLVEQHAAEIQRKRHAQTINWIYPFCVMATLFMVLSGVMVFIMPKFEKIFADYGIDLPAITRSVIRFALWMSGQLPSQVVPGFLGIAMLLLLLGGLLVLRKFAGSWSVSQAVFWYLPMVRRIVRDRAMSDLCYGLGQATEAGMPLHLAVDHASRMTVNPVLASRIRRWGKNLVDGLDQQQGARRAGIPDLVGGMLATASNEQDTAQVFGFLARYYGNRGDKTAILMLAAIEPITVILMGVLVGFVVLGLFMPLVKLIWTMVNLSGP